MNPIVQRSFVRSRTSPMVTYGDREKNLERMMDQIARNLVDRPENVRISMINGQQTLVLELEVAKEDVGKVIGKNGKTANAIRVLLSAVSAGLNKRMVLKIIE